MIEQLTSISTCHLPFSKNATAYLEEKEGTYLIAPLSARFLDAYVANKDRKELRFQEVWRYRRHLNLDDMDFGDDGVVETVQRVVGRRGIGVWRVTRFCA